MAYTEQQWQDNNISAPYGPISAARLQHIEDGLAAVANGGFMSVLPGRGAICLTVDDGLQSLPTQAAMLYARGQRATFGIVSSWIGSTGEYTTWDQVLAAYTQGNEIACHSKTHAHLVTGGLTVGQRVSEYDDSKTAIEAVIGSGNCRSWVYPFDEFNTTTQSELYLRFDRAVAATLPLGVASGVGGFSSLDDVGLTQIPRAVWQSSTHSLILQLIRQAAFRPVILTIEAHGISDLGDTTLPVTLAQFTEALNLAQSLGVPLLTVSQAFTKQSTMLLDPGFETSALTDSFPWVPTVTGTGIAEIIADSASSGLNGTQSLHLKITSGSDLAKVTQSVIVKPGISYTLTGRARRGAGSTPTVNIDEFDAAGTNLGVTNSVTWGSPGTWQPITLTFTTNVATRWVQIRPLVSSIANEMWLDHVHFGPTALGSVG